MTGAHAPPYMPRAGDVYRDRNEVLELRALSDAAMAQRDARKHEWFYHRCPDGAPLLQLLDHVPSASLAGMAAAGPRRMLWHKRPLRAGVLVDLMVAPQHRSLGPAMMLHAALRDQGLQQFALLYGFPNANAVPVFKRMGYRHWGDAVRYARVVRHGDYLARRMHPLVARPLGALVDLADGVGLALRAWRGTRLEPVWTDHVDARMDELWQRSADSIQGLVTVRDQAFLRWRFDEAPGPQTQYLLLSDVTGQLRAWFACQADNGLLHVRDFWSQEAGSGIVRDHVEALLRAARARGHAAVSFEFAGSPQRIAGWLASGFKERERRPVFGQMGPDCGDIDISRELHLTSADEDEEH